MLFDMDDARRDSPLVTAHAGCLGTEPNSRESIVAAYNSPADVVEVDVRISVDGTVFLMHDDRLAAWNGESVPLEHLSWNEIQNAARSGRGGEVLSFEAFCDLVRDIEGRGSSRASLLKKPLLNLDIKDPAALPAAATGVHARNMMSRVFFSGLDERGIALAALCIPDMSYVFNADSVLSGEPAERSEEARIEEACSLALRYGCKGINLEWPKASAALVRSIHEQGLFVMLWTVDDGTDMERVLEYEPDSITTHYPNRLAALLKNRRNAESAGP